MDDYISKTEAFDIVRFECGEWSGLAKTIGKRFDELPSADVQSATPMHWIPVNPFNGGWTERWECSACGNRVTLGYCTDAMEYDFCPYCGAKDCGEQNG